MDRTSYGGTEKHNVSNQLQVGTLGGVMMTPPRGEKPGTVTHPDHDSMLIVLPQNQYLHLIGQHINCAFHNQLPNSCTTFDVLGESGYQPLTN